MYSIGTIITFQRHIARVHLLLNIENMKLANYGVTIHFVRPNCSRSWNLLVTIGGYNPVFVQQYPQGTPTPNLVQGFPQGTPTPNLVQGFPQGTPNVVYITNLIPLQ